MEKLSDRTIDTLKSRFQALSQPLWDPQSPEQDEIAAFIAKNPGLAPLIAPFIQQATAAHLQALASYLGVLGLLGINLQSETEAKKKIDEGFLRKLFHIERRDK